MELPARIALLRKSKKFTQEKLGELVNVSQRSVASWEAGERSPSISTLCDLADKFNVSVDWLLGRTDDEKSSNKKQPAAHGDEPLRLDIIRLIQSLPEQDLPVLSAFLHGMSAGKGIAATSQAAPDPAGTQTE